MNERTVAIFSAALEEVEQELTPPRVTGSDEETPIFARVGAFVALTSLGAPVEQRMEFIGVSVEILRTYPQSLLFAAIDDACRTVRSTRDFVPHVVAAVEVETAKLKAERQIYRRLLELA